MDARFQAPSPMCSSGQFRTIDATQRRYNTFIHRLAIRTAAVICALLLAGCSETNSTTSTSPPSVPAETSASSSTSAPDIVTSSAQAGSWDSFMQRGGSTSTSAPDIVTSSAQAGSWDSFMQRGGSAANTAPAPPDALTGWLMFSRFDESTHTFMSTHIIRPDGSDEANLLLPGPEGGGRWSRDGSQIAVMTVLPDGRIGTAVVQPDSTVDRILEIPDPTLNAVCTLWSPDDSRLACEAWDETDPSRGGIYTVQASDGGDLTRLTTATEGYNDLPGDFSPDGAQLVFMRVSGEQAAPLMTVDVVGGDPRPISEQYFGDPGQFSPDGASVLTSSYGDIILVDLDGKVLETIDEPGASLFGPVWSPDGEWIAYSRGTSGPFADVFISRVDGADRWKVTDTPDNEIRVEWGAE